MFFLGIDLGTSFFKSGVFDTSGKMLGFAREPVPLHQQAKVSELSHTGFINTIRSCVELAIKNAGLQPHDIVSLSYGSQANSFILLDEDYNEISPFSIWNDEQVDLMDEVENFAAKSNFRNTTGIGIAISKQFLINRLKWLQNTKTQFWRRVAHVLTMPDYLCFKLTGEMVTDASTTSLTGLLDFKKGHWWLEATDMIGVDSEQLSRVLPFGAKAGRVNDKGNFLGLKEGTLFCCGGLDHHVAAIGAGVGKLFDISESTGTVIAAVEHGDDCGILKNICVAKGLSELACFRMAFNENGAVALEWYQKNYAREYTIDELITMAGKVSDGSDALVALPCANSYRGLNGFLNIRQSHHHGHFVRAIMESTARSLDLLFKQLQIDSHARIASTGGGARSLLWKRIKNSVTGRELSTLAYSEAACFGAGMIAVAGYGVFNSIYDVQSAWLRSTPE